MKIKKPVYFQDKNPYNPYILATLYVVYTEPGLKYNVMVYNTII